MILCGWVGRLGVTLAEFALLYIATVGEVGWTNGVGVWVC